MKKFKSVYESLVNEEEKKIRTPEKIRNSIFQILDESGQDYLGRPTANVFVEDIMDVIETVNGKIDKRQDTYTALIKFIKVK